MNGKQEKQAYAYWLCCLPGIGNRTIGRLLKAYGEPIVFYEQLKQGQKREDSPQKGELQALLTPRQLAAVREHTARWGVLEEYERLQQSGIFFFTGEDPEYPRRLKEIPDPPYGIFLKGKMPSDEVLSVAVIGARECSEYGRYVAQELGGTLGQRGVQVLSGMARGIDGISQTAALLAGGASFGVLGCGVDICYPAENRALYERLAKEGGLLSCYPPGTLPRACLFPPRNRIVSGLADAVVVVEARQRSGTLITVDMALEQGKEVYVVPGRVTDRLSDGCNRLIGQGAGVLLSPGDFLTEMEGLFPGLRPFSDKRQREDKEGKADKERENDNGRNAVKGKRSSDHKSLEEQLLEELDLDPKSVDMLRERLNPVPSYQQTLQCLMKLCLSGQAIQAAPGYFLKSRRLLF